MFLGALRHNLHKRPGARLGGHAHQGGGAEGASVCSSSRLDMKRMRRKTVPGAAPSTTSSSTKMSPLSFDSRRWITRPCSCCVSSVDRVGVERRDMDRERRLRFLWGGRRKSHVVELPPKAQSYFEDGPAGLRFENRAFRCRGTQQNRQEGDHQAHWGSQATNGSADSCLIVSVSPRKSAPSTASGSNSFFVAFFDPFGGIW